MVAKIAESKTALPEIEWTQDDYIKAAEVITNVTALAGLNLCSARPDEWVPFEEFIAATDRTPAQARGDTGGSTLTIRKHFERMSDSTYALVTPTLGWGASVGGAFSF